MTKQLPTNRFVYEISVIAVPHTVLPLLYSRTSTGAIQEWKIETLGNQFRVTSGQQDGKKVVNEWTTCSGMNIGKKNETSPEEQAINEATSKWEKKSKTGYTEDITKIDSCTSYVEPMLAKNLKDRLAKIDWKRGLLVQLKFNGTRCIATASGMQVLLRSRTGELYLSVPHINKDLEKFFELFPDAVLDGELYNYDLRQKLNELIKLVRKSKKISAADIKLSEEMVKYYVYDGFDFGKGLEESDPYEARKSWIDINLPKFSKYFRPVETTLVHSMDELNVLFYKFLADGEEGCIGRVPGTGYERKRSSFLLKFKPMEDAEFKIINVTQGTGNWAGKARIIGVETYDGREFNADFKGTMEQASEMLNNKQDYIGKTAKIHFFGFTGLKIPNYAKFDYENWMVGDK